MSNTPYVITINFVFPGGDKHAKPTVATELTREDSVPAEFQSVRWVVQANIDDHDGLKITQVVFYYDATKRNAVVTPTFGAGRSVNTHDYEVPINPAVTLNGTETFYYDIKFKDDDFDNLSFDPTLKIQPRTAAGQSSSGAGA